MADRETTMAIGAVVIALDTLVKILDDKGVIEKQEYTNALEMILSDGNASLDSEFCEVLEHIITRVNS